MLALIVAVLPAQLAAGELASTTVTVAPSSNDSTTTATMQAALHIQQQDEVLVNYSGLNGSKQAGTFLDWMLEQDQSVAGGNVTVAQGGPIASVVVGDSPDFVRAPITGVIVRTIAISPGDQLQPDQAIAVMQAVYSTTSPSSEQLQGHSEGPVLSKHLDKIVNMACTFVDLVIVLAVVAGLWWSCSLGQAPPHKKRSTTEADRDPLLHAARAGVLATS